MSSEATSSGLLAIGAQCSASGCLTVDFLPLRCACDKSFCTLHIAADDHDCSARTRSVTAAPSTTADTKPIDRCNFKKGCTRPSLGAYFDDNERKAATLCPRCAGDFCAAHRYPESHACEGPDPATDVSTTKNVAGQALLAKHFSTAGSTPLSTAQRTTKKVVTDPKKIAQMQKVALMQLRHRAIPADPKDKPSSVPLVDQRLHAKVVFEGSGTEKAFWFRKSVGAGRAVDMLATHFGLSGSASISLLKEELGLEERVALDLGNPLADQISDGAKLVLVRSDS